MTTARRFCAEDSARIGDPLAGTATHAERNLLLGWPRRKWQRSLRQASDMPEAVRTRLEDLADRGRRVNLIHRRGQPDRLHRVYLMPERQAFDVWREELPAFLQAFAAGDCLQCWRVGPVERELVLCCTHGRKDKCCAKFGYRTYRAIADVVHEQGLPFDVWESTHLGGCRLAASVILLPTLRKYGRVSLEHVAPLLQSEARGQPYLPCYRGDSRLSPVQQCAQVAALMWLHARGVEARITIEEMPAQRDGERVLRARWYGDDRQGCLRVTCRASELVRHDTCADHETGAKASSVWHAVDIGVDAAPGVGMPAAPVAAG